MAITEPQECARYDCNQPYGHKGQCVLNYEGSKEQAQDQQSLDAIFRPEQRARLDRVTLETAVHDLLTALGVDEGDHTADTPARAARAWKHILSGYDEDPALHLRTTFSAPQYPGIIIVSGIKLHSTCAHHLLPIQGRATVAYRPQPGQRVVGLSKLARVVDGYARRLQVQERIGYQVVEAIEQELRPAGAACIITATHGCMNLRGVQEHNAKTTTTAVIGEWISSAHPDLAEVYATHRSHH